MRVSAVLQRKNGTYRSWSLTSATEKFPESENSFLGHANLEVCPRAEEIQAWGDRGEPSFERRSPEASWRRLQTRLTSNSVRGSSALMAGGGVTDDLPRCDVAVSRQARIVQSPNGRSVCRIPMSVKWTRARLRTRFKIREGGRCIDQQKSCKSRWTRLTVADD